MMVRSMGSCLLSLLAFSCVLVQHVQPAYQDYDIYSGEHLDDVIMRTDGSGVTDKDGVLVVYEEECRYALDAHGMQAWGLPLTKYVVFMKHDYVTTQTNTWYGYNGDDIRARYNVTACWEVLFISRGSTRSTEPRRWRPELGRGFVDWVWDQIRFPIKLINYNAFPVKVSIVPGFGEQGGPDKFEPFQLQPSEHVLVMIPLSNLVTAHTWETWSDLKHYVGAWRVTAPGDEIPVLGSRRDDADYHSDLSGLKATESSDDTWARDWVWTSQLRHLLNLKQPLVTPNFTATGFVKQRIPSEWYAVLRNFYHGNRAHLREHEDWKFVDSVVNYDEVPTTMVHLTEPVKRVVSRGLQAVMEEWCGLRLEMTAFYGVREYYRGSILRHHVDRVESHVISAILQVAQEGVAAGEEWMLEAIDFSGDRHQVSLQPGEMLLYESAKLIHGRPKPLKGDMFANVFLHYRPADGAWADRYSRMGLTLLHPPDEQERLLPFASDLTREHAHARELVGVHTDEVTDGTKDEL